MELGRLLRAMILCLIGWTIPASAETRIALVIGNATYANTAPLVNPINDANDVASALQKLGFHVDLALNTSKMALEKAIQNFSGRLRQSDPADTIALFYYAGHGIQVNDRNYLVPIDATLEEEADLMLQAVLVDVVLEQIQYWARVKMVFLDACRDNPFVPRLARSTMSRSSRASRGLAAVNASEVDVANGLLIAYATAPKSTAADGYGRNSPFTAALLANIATPGLSVQLVLQKVRADVVEQTKNLQIPWESSSLTSDFMFVPKPGQANSQSGVQIPHQDLNLPLPPEVPSNISTAEAFSKGTAAEALKDYNEAIFWYRLSAGNGDVSAIYRVGQFYENGQVEKQDYAEAMRWYRRAADKGYDMAMYDLGNMYQRGLGVIADLDQARTWFRMASDRGNDEADKILRQLVKPPPTVSLPSPEPPVEQLPQKRGSKLRTEEPSSLRQEPEKSQNTILRLLKNLGDTHNVFELVDCKASPISINLSEMRGPKYENCIFKTIADPATPESSEKLHERNVKLSNGLIDIVWRIASHGGYIPESPINIVLPSQFGSILNEIAYLENRGTFNSNGRSFELVLFRSKAYKRCMGFVSNGNKASKGVGFESRIYGFYCRNGVNMTNRELNSIIDAINVQVSR